MCVCTLWSFYAGLHATHVAYVLHLEDTVLWYWVKNIMAADIEMPSMVFVCLNACVGYFWLWCFQLSVSRHMLRLLLPLAMGSSCTWAMQMFLVALKMHFPRPACHVLISFFFFFLNCPTVEVKSAFLNSGLSLIGFPKKLPSKSCLLKNDMIELQVNLG